MFFSYHILKLILKLGFKIKSIISSMVKKTIIAIWVNKTISQLDTLFKENQK